MEMAARDMGSNKFTIGGKLALRETKWKIISFTSPFVAMLHCRIS